MTADRPGVQVSALHSFRAFVAQRGLSADDLLRKSGIGPTTLEQGDRRIGFDRLAALFELAAVATGDTTFGLQYAEKFPPGASGTLGHAMLTSANVETMLQTASRFADLFVDVDRPNLAIGPLGASVSWAYNVPNQNDIRQLSEFLAALLVMRVRIAAGPDWQPTRAIFTHNQPPREASGRLAALFGPAVSFGGRSFLLGIDRRTLERPLPLIAVGLYEMIRDYGEQQLSQRRRAPNLFDQVKSELDSSLAAERAFDLDSIATQLGLGSRTLQWRLGQIGHSYEEALKDVRRTTAEALLRDSTLSFSAISRRLGYSEQSAFNRWIVSTYAMTPTALRQQLRDLRDRA